MVTKIPKYLNNTHIIYIIMKKNNTSNTKIKISLNVPEKLLKKIDKARGLIPRTAFITEKLKRIRWGK